MPKMKTHKGTAKRFKKTGSGKLKRSHAFKNHILTKKSPKRVRQLRKAGLVSKGDQKRIESLITYMK